MPSTAIGVGTPGQILSEAAAREVVREGLASLPLDGKRVLFIIPDSTRTAPIPFFFKEFFACLHGKAKAIDYLVALGTHMPMSEEALNKLVGVTAEERKTKYAGVNIFNHDWQNPQTLKTIGRMEASEIKEISRGLLELGLDVSINKLVFDYDHIIVCGPVFPHEVVGFSGGNKYFFPGVSGPDVINLTHWVGALITCYEIIGTMHTPVREIINRAAKMIQVPKSCFAFVVKGHDLAGLYFGTPEEAWAEAAQLSAQTHVLYPEKPFHTILSVMPHLYDDIWTGAKGMYKLEPVCADGGEVIIYAPHIDEISYVHGKIIDEIGYHTRDYFIKQWDKFKGYPWGTIAHSTHLKGMGSFDNGVEKPRIRVTLATKIPEARCKKVNLGYRDPDSINPQDFANKEKEGILLVPKAGEMLYRLKK